MRSARLLQRIACFGSDVDFCMTTHLLAAEEFVGHVHDRGLGEVAHDVVRHAAEALELRGELVHELLAVLVALDSARGRSRKTEVLVGG